MFNRKRYRVSKAGQQVAVAHVRSDDSDFPLIDRHLTRLAETLLFQIATSRINWTESLRKVSKEAIVDLSGDQPWHVDEGF